MTKSLKYILLIVGVIILLSLLVHSCNELKYYKGYSRTLENEVSTWTDKYGKEHYLTQSISLEKDELFKKYQLLETGLKLKEKQLVEFKSLTSLLSKNVKLKVDTVYYTKVDSRVDTVLLNTFEPYYLHFVYSDEWLDISGDVGNQDLLDLQVRDSIIFTTYTKRLGLKKHTYLDVVNKNPYVKLSNIESFKLPEERTILTIGPMVGGGYDPSTNSFRPFIGIGLSYYPLTLKIKKRK